MIGTVRFLTNHDRDNQVTDLRLSGSVDEEYRRVRRDLNKCAPRLYVSSSIHVIPAGSGSINLPSTYGGLRRLEVSCDGSTTGDFRPVIVADDLYPDQDLYGDVGFREEGGVLYLSPTSEDRSGTYRLVHNTLPAPNTFLSGSVVYGYSELDLPDPLHTVVAERACATLGPRLKFDPTPHLDRAERIWVATRRDLKNDYGVHVEPGLRPRTRPLRGR